MSPYNSTLPHAVMQAVVEGATPAKAWREHLGISQAGVAARLEISQSAYSQQESSDKPSPDSLQHIANTLGLTLEQLDF
ncbi:helix-turn-helix domain-containing protein [Aquitalea sp. ASV11]|uniref:helix-turn-helix domain-containing protein n=1 Tax=Aquitalea sp. ASV11 TaxID=2795103 RepID=UPI0018ED79AA|nr:helix-turn-helix transcriptional regulator [Aquitalea sp. ASV11]